MVSISITDDVRMAIEAWKNENKYSCDDIGKFGGVARSAVARWFNGEAKTMRRSTWLKLLPHIEKYLPKDFSLPTNNNGAMIVNNGGVNNGNAVSGYYFSQMIKKILDSDKLTAEEKVKVISVLNED